MPLEDGEQAAVGAAPHPRGVVIAGRDNVLTVRGELRMLHWAIMRQRQQQMAISGPHPCRVVVARSNNVLAVRRELGILYPTIVLERGQQAVISGVPYPHGMILAGCDDALAVGGEGRVP